MIISHRLDPLISVVDYWIEMTSQGLSHVKEVTILSHLPLDIDTLRCKWFGNCHCFHMTEPLTSHLNPIINHRDQGI